jgi:hypothetical protein
MFITAVIVFSLAGIRSVIAAPADAPGFADPAMQRVWERTDLPVANGTVKRSFYWGPAPFTGALQEDYDAGPGGKHLVQYFDKGRMEINDPAADKSNPFYVTPGRLTVEMIHGIVQVGKGELGTGKYKRRYPAYIPIAGDADDTIGPTYANFLTFGYYLGDKFAQNLTGQKVIGFMSRERGAGENAGYGSSGVKYVYFERATGMNIPDVFWTFLNATGPIVQNGRVTNGRLSNPYFYVTGYPITDAYWSWAKINGKPNTDVLIQLYERRVLTYVPSAPAGFKVQMGNIGQHYYDWRYKDAGKPPPIKCTSGLQPQGRFGAIWSGDSALQYMLLCPLAAPASQQVVIQHFEHGHMVFADRTGIEPSYDEHPKRIYVLYEDDHSSEYFVDYYYGEQYEPTPPPIPPAPPGLEEPKLGFGKVWKEHPEVRRRLGYALGPESPVASKDFQTFQMGYMVSDGKQIYTFVIYNSYPTVPDLPAWDWRTLPDPEGRP